jgi:mRNA interferase MazF
MLFEQGDIVEISFDPSKGHEPKRKRPALVVSCNDFNGSTSMAIVCPITTKDNGFFLHEPIPARHDIYGFVVMEQLRAVDLIARRAEKIDHLDEKEMKPILSCVMAFY